MLIKISTSQVKTSALYRKQIEIYCERLRKKNQFNPVVISGLGGGGEGRYTGVEMTGWSRDVKNQPPPPDGTKKKSLYGMYLLQCLCFSSVKNMRKKRYLSVWPWAKKQETNCFVLFNSVLRSTGFKWAKVTLFQANAVNIWIYENIKTFSNAEGCTPYDGLYGEASPERGTVRRLQVLYMKG